MPSNLSAELSLRKTTPVVQKRSLVLLVALLSPRMAYPTDPSDKRSSDTRAATEIADNRRGWVTRIDAEDPRPLRMRESRMNCGTFQVSGHRLQSRYDNTYVEWSFRILIASLNTLVSHREPNLPVSPTTTTTLLFSNAFRNSSRAEKAGNRFLAVSISR